MSDQSSGNGLEERRYAQHDANFNTTSITNASGIVQERFIYDAYGTVTRLSSSWSDSGFTSTEWKYLYQGARYDEAANLYDLRFRDYDPSLGRFLENDPIRQGDGPNMYQFVHGNPLNFVDPSGLTTTTLAPTTPEEIRLIVVNGWPVLIGIGVSISEVAPPVAIAVGVGAGYRPGEPERLYPEMPSLTPQELEIMEKHQAVPTPILNNSSSQNGGQQTGGSPGATSGSGSQSTNPSTQPSQRPYKPFRPSDKERVKSENREKNNGQLICDDCGVRCMEPRQHQRGVIPPDNEAHVDHMYPRSEGGSGTVDNARILCRKCNLAKGARILAGWLGLAYFGGKADGLQTVPDHHGEENE